MVRHIVPLLASAMLVPAQAAEPSVPSAMPVPANYREWVFLTSSLDLNYNRPVPGAGAMSLLDNVYVNPEAYRAYVVTGTWPDGTVLVKENRLANPAGSIAQDGKVQGRIASMELHVKDARMPTGWAFFVSDGKAPGAYMPPSTVCYSCHTAHAAVDTTFVQFYPTLSPIAEDKHTLSAAYLKDEAGKPK